MNNVSTFFCFAYLIAACLNWVHRRWTSRVRAFSGFAFTRWGGYLCVAQILLFPLPLGLAFAWLVSYRSAATFIYAPATACAIGELVWRRWRYRRALHGL